MRQVGHDTRGPGAECVEVSLVVAHVLVLFRSISRLFNLMLAVGPAVIVLIPRQLAYLQRLMRRSQGQAKPASCVRRTSQTEFSALPRSKVGICVHRGNLASLDQPSNDSAMFVFRPAVMRGEESKRFLDCVVE